MNNNQKLINNFLSYLVSRGVSKKSLKFYKSDISNFLDWANDQEISNNLVRQYIQSQKLITPPSTINRRLSTLRSFASFNSRGFMDGIENVSYPKVSSGSKYQVSRFSPYKKVQEWLLNKTRSERLKNYLSKLFFSRPNWYKRYHSYPLSTYIHIAILILFTSISGYGVYDQVFRGSSDSLAFPTALTRPNRYLSFQGRLTDNLGNPETTATNMVFKLYDASSGGTELWNSNTCSVTPDQDGIFSLLLGTTSGSGFTCGSATEIASSVFSENAEVWLGVTVGADSEATPRIQIATVAYALNSEALQGYPAGTGTSTIPYINSSGEVVLANASPTIESTSGTFAVKGQAMTISTADTTNGNITINPDGTGTLNLTFEGTSAGGSANGFVNATNANITSGSLYAGTVASDATGYNFINFISGTTPTSKFSVSATGLTTIGADLYVSSGISTFGTAVSDGTVEATKFCTGDGETNCVTDFSTLGGGSSKWNAITNPDGNTSLSHSTYTTTFNWATGTGTDNLFSLTSDASANGTGALLNLQTGASSSLMPLRVRAGSAEAIAVDSSGKVGIGDTSPVSLFTVGSGDLFQVNSSGIIASIDGVAHIIDDVSGNLTLKSNSTAVSIDDDLYVSSGISTFGTAVTDGTVEATKFCTGDGETNCVTDFAPIVSGSLLWTSSGSLLYPTTLTKLVGIGTNSPISRLSVINNPGAGNYTGKAAFLVDQYESQDILTASASGVTKMTLQSDGTLKLVNASSTISNDSGDISIVPAGGNLSITGNTITSGVIQAGNTSAVSYSRLGSGTTGHSGNLSAASDLLLQDLEVDGTLFLDGGTIANSAGTASIILSSTPTTTPAYLTAQNWFVENTANVGQAALMVNQTKAGDLFTASASGTTKFTIQNDGDVVLTNGQLRLGNLSSAPTAEGAGSMFFNTTTNTNQCYNGTNWYNCGGTLYSNTNASVADGSYITVNHALATNDLLSSAWINAQGVWKSLDANYKPAIAWEGKDTQKGIYHNNINSYISGNETGAGTSTLHDGLIFDTFEDTSKTDSANTSASLAIQMGDNGSSNYTTLNQRVQTGRIGLMGGQTYNSSTTDNDGQTYLGSNTVNDIYYYDRGKDSIPEVLVELGIDPNWYNGVTLSVATSSASYSQSGTLADKNPNLTPNYNGSLIKATGTDTEPRTIYITIKSPTTFDWTNYQGDSATGVTITAGTAQTLGSTGVSVTFTGGVNYNVGDVFKIASWYIEGESATRGAKQQFPERANVIGSGSSSSVAYVDIIDADTQKLWIRFSSASASNMLDLGSAATNGTVTSVQMLNGQLYAGMIATGGADGRVNKISFVSDSKINYYNNAAFGIQQYKGSISQRADNLGSNITYGSPMLVSSVVNDVAAAVIPNQPTQEVTVSGWGYIAGNAVYPYALETVNLPYTFNNKPNVVINGAGSYVSVSGGPTSLSQCGSETNTMTSLSTISNNSFVAIASNDDGTVLQPSWYYCYTWTATGTVSPKQFVAVATGATGADGGTTIINETDGTKIDISVGSQNVNAIRSSKVAMTSLGNLYIVREDATANSNILLVYYGIAGISTETSLEQYRNGYYYTQNSGWNSSGGPTPLGTSGSATTITSLAVTENTSTVDPNSNTIYLGSDAGTTVLQEKQGHANISDGYVENGGSVKYYTKDYISEEMIGDIRGMWPLSSNGSLSMSDASIKANTLTNNNSVTATSGVRGVAASFNGTNQFLSCTDAACGGTSKLDYTGNGGWSFGAWFKQTSTSGTQVILSKAGSSDLAYSVSVNSGTINANVTNTAGSWDASLTSSVAPIAGQWYHVVVVYSPSTSLNLYVNGQLANGTLTGSIPSTIRNSASNFVIGNNAASGVFFNGSIDEVFVTATTLTPAQIKNMYQVGYRALQSHASSGLGSSAADTNQQLGGTTNTIGVVQPDYNNQFMYVGTNHTTNGALSKIQLNSDTNVKTYNSSANVPAGGALLIDEDVTSLAVGETLYAVGSAASGVKSMGVDDNATATSGNFVSKTYALPKNIGSAVLWVSPVIDGSDGSNTLTVKASNDGGSNYVTCTLVGTDSNRNIPEKEYACTFSTADNDLKVKFEFARGSTKTNTYVTEYGITWLGETGFRVEQADSNNVRLYNFSGETQNLKLNVTGASVAALANPWTDAGSYLYATGYETLRLYDGAGTNYLGLSHDGTLANLTYNGTTVLSINSNGDLLPNTDDTQSLGSNTKRWKDLFLGGETLHIGTSLTDEGTISYDTTNNILNFGTDSTSNGDIAFFTDDLYLDKSSGNVGIGTTSPAATLDVEGVALSAIKVGSSNPLYLIHSDPTLGMNAYYSSGWKYGKGSSSHYGAFFGFDANGTGNIKISNTAATGNENEAATMVERFTITPTGNVGIGTTSPAAKLDIVGENGSLVSRFSTATTGTIRNSLALNNSGSSNWSSQINFQQQGTTKWSLANDLNANGGQNFTIYDNAAGVSRIFIDSTGNVGIGTINPGGHKLSVVGTAGLSTGTAWTNTSDVRLKTVEDNLSGSSLDKLMALRPVSFRWNELHNQKFGSDSNKLNLGFVAQEVEDILPDMITTDENGYKWYNPSGFEALLTAGIQEQQGQINNIKNQVANLVSNTVARFTKVETNLISPVPNTDLVIDLQPDNSQSASKLVIKGENDLEVASVDAEGNASFSGQLTSNELQVANDATISGTLYADNIESKRLQDIEDLLREVETNQQILTEASSWNLNTATNSADLATYFDLHTTNLYVTGQTALSSLFISDNFTTRNINSLEGPLEIQSLAASPLEIMAGKILIDTDGNTKFLGNVEVAGNLTINNLVVANNIDPIATESAQVVEGEINSNSTAGKATLSANTEKIRINNNKVSLNTLIYITPITSTQNKVLFVKEKGQGYFDIGFSDLLDSDVEFNWWIIELK